MNDSVGVLGKLSVGEEWIRRSPVRVPNRLTAAAMTQRTVAEYARRQRRQAGRGRASRTRAGYAEFSPDDLAPELAVNPNQAEAAMLNWHQQCGITGGWLLAFINSFDELTMSVFVTSPQTVTLPVRMYMYATESIDPMMASVSAIVIFITAGAMLILDRIYGLNRILIGQH